MNGYRVRQFAKGLFKEPRGFCGCIEGRLGIDVACGACLRFARLCYKRILIHAFTFFPLALSASFTALPMSSVAGVTLKL